MDIPETRATFDTRDRTKANKNTTKWTDEQHRLNEVNLGWARLHANAKQFLFLIRQPSFSNMPNTILLIVQNLFMWNKINTVNPVYKDHSREPQNMAFMSTCLLYTG